jgi:hypothetical protein
MAIPDRAFVEMHLRTVRPECDLPESPDDDAEVRIGRGLKHPKDKGYATFLMTLGYDRNWAGMLAAKIVEEGRVRAATAQKKTEFARALRRLANPGLNVKAFLADGQFVLEATNGTLLTDDLFDELTPFDGLLIIHALQLCLAGDKSRRTEVVSRADAIWSRVRSSPMSRQRTRGAK